LSQIVGKGIANDQSIVEIFYFLEVPCGIYMQNSFLIVPIHLEAHVQDKSGYLAVEPMANFRNLPYCDRTDDSTPKLREINPNASGRDILSGTPYISEKIVSQPFQNRNLLLSPGIHLHWELPKALRTGEQKEESLNFPTTPNRWLVIRRQGETIEAEWIVESDYLWPVIPDTEKTQNTPNSVCIPYPPNPQEGKYQPFRYLGRQLSLADWLNDRKTHEYWGEFLTVIGYGEPTFAAFYPNCYSVFGCQDTKPGNVNSHLSYEVIGWHSEIEFDYMRSLISDYSPQSERSLKEFIEDKIKWKIDTNLEEIQTNLQTIYYGCLEFQPNNSESIQENLPELDSVILANSGTEALSAYIAHKIAQKDQNLSKFDIENQLEAIQLLRSLTGERDNLENKLREARREKEFIAHSSGIVWTIEKIDKKPNNYLQTDHSEKTPLNLPENIAEKLKNLNLHQKNYNRIQHETELQRQQIFADWYKYLICLYPPSDNLDRYPRPELVRDFMNSEISRLRERKAESERIKNDLGTCFTNLKNNLDELNSRSKASTDRPQEYQLKPLPAPRYWQPNEPVVMTVFKLPKEQISTPRETINQEFLECFTLKIEDSRKGKNLFDAALATQLWKIMQQQPERKKQFTRVWRSPAWKPFLLEWEVQITSIRNQREYLSDFIERHYQTNDTLINFQPKSDTTQYREPQKDVYSGRSILTEYASDQHKQQIEAFFTQKNFFPQFCKDQSIEPTYGWLNQHIRDFKEWIIHQEIPEPQKQFFNRLLDIYESFQELQCLSQTFNGFNQALLGRKQTLQLTIDDPIGFESNRPFVELVRDAVQNSIISAPQPLNFFNPIRSGSLKILRLRLVDTFGRVRDLQLTQTITPEHLKTNHENAVNLPPRIVQPARINFRWLSGNSHHIYDEASSHPSLNPICGWILPDRIDKTLKIYNTEGHSLGELEIHQAGNNRWRSAPGSEFAVQSVNDIPNPHLNRVVSYLNATEDKFLADFVKSLGQAWEQIDPDVGDRNPSLALIMGQPIAIVRASLNLQLQGLPAINQDWAVFKRDLEQYRKYGNQQSERETNGFTNVQFPIYLGNHQHLSDGLIGYWRETHNDKNIVLSDKVYIPLGNKDEATNNGNTKNIEKQHQAFYQTLQSPPEFLTILIDPRATIQAVSGILPTKSIQIPSEFYVNILNNISITFLAAPILSPGIINIPLANAIDSSWSWLEQQKSWHYLEVSSIGQIERDRFIDYFDSIAYSVSGNQVWDYLCQEKIGWLKPNNNVTNCWVLPREKRASPQLEKPYKVLQNQIEILLDRLANQVRPTTVEATFFPPQIREGWLKLAIDTHQH
jgi:hypothetical protein